MVAGARFLSQNTRHAGSAVAEPSGLKAPKGFTFGCDPEGFLFKGSEPVSAGLYLPGTKEAPYAVKKGAIQVDGMAAEFNIDPASSYEEWEDNITTVMAELETFLPKDVKIKYLPSVTFSEKNFDAAPDTSKELGCTPDFDAWEQTVNPPPNPSNPFLRCAGGHLHVGWSSNEDITEPQHVMNCCDLVKQFDWFLGGWAVNYDTDTSRRELYGKMGACRFKPYGVEYRVLSNFWVENKTHRLSVWNRMVHAIQQMNKIFLPDRIPVKLRNMLAAAIQNSKLNNMLAETCQYPLKTLNVSSCNW